MNESFSATTRRIAADADKATERVVLANRQEWCSIPAQYRVSVRQLMRASYFEGRGDGASFIADSMGVKP